MDSEKGSVVGSKYDQIHGPYASPHVHRRAHMLFSTAPNLLLCLCTDHWILYNLHCGLRILSFSKLHEYTCIHLNQVPLSIFCDHQA